MHKGIPMKELAAELQRQLDTKTDYVADTRRMSVATVKGETGFGGATALAIDDPDGLAEYVVSDYCHGQIAERVQIPKRFYDRLREDHPDLYDSVVNALWSREPQTRLVRTLDGRARAFLSDRYHRIDNVDIMEVVWPILREIKGVEVKSCALTERKMYIKVSFPSIRKRLTRRVGDTLQAGLEVSNSEVGAGRFSIAPWTLKLDCLNGMTHTEYGEGRTHLGAAQEEGRVSWSDETLRAADEAFKLEVRDIVSQVATQASFDALVEDMRWLPQFRVEGDPPAIVEKLADRHDLTDGERSSVLQHLIEGGDLSAWGYVNAVTRAASDVEDYDRSSELERLGGAMASEDGPLVAVLS
jgi:hypothetical protein